jgi:hypothetical protein
VAEDHAAGLVKAAPLAEAAQLSSEGDVKIILSYCGTDWLTTPRLPTMPRTRLSAHLTHRLHGPGAHAQAGPLGAIPGGPAVELQPSLNVDRAALVWPLARLCSQAVTLTHCVSGVARSSVSCVFSSTATENWSSALPVRVKRFSGPPPMRPVKAARSPSHRPVTPLVK